MKYILKPSLEHIALVKVVASLWNQNDVKNLLAKFSIPNNYEQFRSEWVGIETETMKKITNLPLPEHVKQNILGFIRPIGLQIAKWKHFHYKSCNLTVDLPNEFCWTPQGTIDRKKTAEVMIKDQTIDITTRYKLACIFCFEDDIPKLWDEMPESCKETVYGQEDQINVKELVAFWTYQISGKVDKMNGMIEKRVGHKCSPYRYAFNLSVVGRNKVAAEYFLQKLTTAQKEKCLINAGMCVPIQRLCYFKGSTVFLRENISEILCFVLSQLDEEQQIEVFKRHPNKILACFLDWPSQAFFMQTANRMWSFLPKTCYQFIFTHFTAYIMEGYKDFNYRKLFQEFWEQSPNDYKKHVLSGSIICHILSQLFMIRDYNNIKLVLQNATPEDKKRIIYDKAALDICDLMMLYNQKPLLQYFLKECLPSKDDMVEFKKFYDANAHYVHDVTRQKFFCICDEIFCQSKKRKSVEGECSKAKRV